MVDRLNRSRRDKLDWAARLGLGPLAGGEVPPPPGGEVPRNVRDAMAQKNKADEMAELRRRIDQKGDVVAPATDKKETEEEDMDASGFLNPNAKAGAKKKVAPKSVLELRIGTKPTVVVTSRPDEPDRIEEEPSKDLRAERRAKQKAATRFQDVEEEYSYESQHDRRKKRRGRVAYDDEESDRRGRMRSRSGRYSEDPYGSRRRPDRSRSMDGYYDSDDSSEVRKRRKREEKRKREEWRKEWKKKKEMEKRREGQPGVHSSDEESGDFERGESADRSPVRKSKTAIGVPEVQVDHVGGVQRRYVGQLRDSELSQRLRRAEELHGLNTQRKLLTEAEAIALVQGGSKRRTR